MSDISHSEIATETISALLEGVDDLPGVTLDARDGMGVRLHTTAQVKDWLVEEMLIADRSAADRVERHRQGEQTTLTVDTQALLTLREAWERDDDDAVIVQHVCDLLEGIDGVLTVIDRALGPSGKR